MNDVKRRILLAGLKLFDLALVALSFGLATTVVGAHVPRVSLEEFLSMRIKLSNFAIFAAMLLVWHIIFLLCEMYESKRLSTRPTEIIDILKTTALIATSLVVASQLFHIRMVSFRFVVLFWIFSSAFDIVGRISLRYLLGAIRRHGRNLRHILILGTNLRAVTFAKRIEGNRALGYRVLGFVDNEWAGIGEAQAAGYPIRCNLAGLAEYLRRNVVDEIALYLPLRSFYEHSFQVAALCERHGTILRLDSDIFNLKIARSRAEFFDGHSQFATYSRTHEGWPILVKRALDFGVSLILLFLSAPLLFVTALLIKLTSEGPVLFVQQRVGLNKRRFPIYKFRTMVRHAERLQAELEYQNEVSGPVFKIKHDPRMTSLGKFLRRTSIDELPQLINVLKGDMSLVGPRPLPVRDYEGFNEDWQRRRFSVRPGITCLWQVNGRSSVSFEQWMKLDIQYLDEWSLWLDLKILARTIPAVLRGLGAA
jgi:exopolysaccharide biosynthesis polyprenyl glycosylphosphotransferase